MLVYLVVIIEKECNDFSVLIILFLGGEDESNPERVLP